jgi:1-phosphatidylinositol-4-phosphate 5-kinase
LEKNEKQIEKTKESMGKSGSFFFFTWDDKYILKTLYKHELDLLNKNFYKDYKSHSENNPNSLLAKIFGYLTIKIEGL